MDTLLPDRLKELWGRVERKQLTVADAGYQQERLLDEYRAIWTQALILEGREDLRQSLLSELAEYLGCVDLAALESSCKDATRALSDDWRRMVDPADTKPIERFYDQGQGYLFELTWWHALVADHGPLAYVLALDFARQRQRPSLSRLRRRRGGRRSSLRPAWVSRLPRRHQLDSAQIQSVAHGAARPGGRVHRSERRTSSVRCLRCDHGHGCLRASPRSGQGRRSARDRVEARGLSLRPIRRLAR